MIATGTATPKWKVVGEAAHQHTAGPIITNVQGSEASARATPNSACSGGGATM